MSAIFKYILDFKANTEKVTKEVNGLQGMLKGAAVAAGAMFAADKVMEAAAAVAEYAQEISNTKIAVETLAGVHGAAANKMAGEVTAIAQGYGVEVNEALEASNVMMKSFGQSSTEAFDLLNVAMSGAANSNGELLAQVREYSPHFKEAGLSAQEMFSIIAAGNKVGVFDDKTADMIKEGSIRLREMTQSTKDAINGLGLSSTEIQRAIAEGSMTSFEAMQKISNKLKEFPQQAPQVGAALADIFGGPGEDGVNFARILGDIDLSMQGLVDSATASQVRYTAALAEFHTVGASVFGGTTELLNNMKAIGMEALNAIIKGTVSVINYFIDLYNESAVVRGAFQYIGFAVKTVFGEISLVFKNFFNNLKGMGEVVKAIFTGNFKEIPGIIEKMFETDKANVVAFGAKTVDNFKLGVQNTLTPREKIKLISFDAEATQVGTSAGTAMAKATAAQMANAFKGGSVRVSNMTSMKSETISSISLGGVKGVSTANTGLANMSSSMTRLNKQTKELQENFIGIGNVGIDLGSTALPAIQEGFATLGTSIGEALTGTASAGDIFKSLIGVVADFMWALGKSMIATGTAGIAFKQLIASPWAAVAAGVALIALSGAVTSMLSSGPTAMANGGLLYGPTNVIAGEYPGARSNPEVIAPLSKLQNIIGDRGNSSQYMQVEVVGSISGDTIRLSQKRADRKRNQFN